MSEKPFVYVVMMATGDYDLYDKTPVAVYEDHGQAVDHAQRGNRHWEEHVSSLDPKREWSTDDAANYSTPYSVGHDVDRGHLHFTVLVVPRLATAPY